MDMLSLRKSVGNCQCWCQLRYDLHKMKYDIDEVNKTITIVSIPKEEIKISGYSVLWCRASKLKSIYGDDYNKINKSVKANLAKKIEKSSLKTECSK
jgi:hypothetical protein